MSFFLKKRDKGKLGVAAAKSLARGGKDDISLCYGERTDDPMLIQRDPKHCWHGAQVSGAQVGDIFKTGTTTNWVALVALASALGLVSYSTSRQGYVTTSVVLILAAILVAVSAYMSFRKSRA